MPKFRFAVRSREGKLRSGTVTETSLEAAKKRLIAAGFAIVTLQEESELVIHEAKAPTGVARPKTERAAIIEFEMTAFERAWDVLDRYLLRKEVAALLFVAGLGLAGYLYLTRPKPPLSAEARYEAIEVELVVELDAMSEKGKLYKAVLPDIPWQFTQPVADGPVLQTSFEAVKRPARAEVSLIDDYGEVVATGESTLSTRAEGKLGGTVALTPVKKAP